MTKEEFNALELEQQVQYINKGLETQSLVKVCQAMGISEATVRDRFKSKGYARQGKQFVTTGDTVNTSNTSNTPNTKDTNNTDNTSKPKTQRQNNNSNIKALENRVGSLEKELEQLKAMILCNTNNTSATINTNNTGIVMYSSENLVSRNYKIDRAVADEFVKFCKVQKLTNDYKVSDLATNALLEYMEMFNK